MAEWIHVNAEDLKPFEPVPGGDYSSKLLTGGQLAGSDVININEGTLIGGGRTGGGAHEKTEIYYIVSGSGDLWLDDDCLHVKPGDVIVIPPGVVHWIDNRMNKEPFVLHTYWHRQEDNGLYHRRLEEWGTSVRRMDEE